MPAFAAPRPASTTPPSTPAKATSGGQHTRTRPRSAVPPMTGSQFEGNRDWELDRIRRLLYEQECVELKGQLEEKQSEIEVIKSEKNRITKSFWEGRTRAMALLATLTRKREELARVRGGQHARGKKASTLFSSFASASADGSGAGSAQPAAAAEVASAGEDSDLQTLQALTTIITELGNVSDSISSSGGGDDALTAEKQKGPEEEGANPAAASTTPEKVGKGEAAAAEAPAAAIAVAAAAAVTALCCSKCQGSLEEGADVKEQAKAPTVNGETQTTAAAADEAPATAAADGAEFDVDLFKLKRQAAKLRDELAKKRFAEMALDVRLNETEEEAARLAELLRAKEAVVESLRLELEEKDARLMEFVSRVHDIEVRLARVARERDEKTAEAEAAVEAVRFYQAREELSVCDDASHRTSLASQQPLPGTAASSRASSVSPSITGGVVEEMKSGRAGGQQEQGQEQGREEDAEVAKAVADNKGPSPTPSTAASSASPTDTDTDGSLGSVELVEAVTLEDDEGHQALRALHTPLERLVEEGMALFHKMRQPNNAVLAPIAMATAALFALGLIVFLVRAAFGAPTTAPAAANGAVEDAWTGAKRSPLLRLTPGGAPLLAGEYLSSCAPAVDGPRKACYFLWNQLDGNLVLYRGFTPARHRGPIWSTNTLVVPGLFPERGEQQEPAAAKEQQVGDHWGAANVTVWLTADRTLQLVDAPSGKVMWQRRAWRLPRELIPWPFGR